MANDKTFGIKLIEKVPYVTSFLLTIVAVLASVSLLLYFFFVPSDGSSLEMKSAYYIIAVPEFWKKVSVFSAVGVVIVYPLYLFIRTYKSASLKFSNEAVIIDRAGKNYFIALGSICNFQIHESIVGDRFTVRINKDDKTSIVFKLEYPVQADEVITLALEHQINIEETATRTELLYRKYIPLIQDGLQLIGHKEMLEIVQKADNEYMLHKDKFDSLRKSDNWEPLYDNLKNFDVYDSIYYQIHDKTMDLIEAYVRNHPGEFVNLK
jgi:hypothetical protein